jgi:hypothetical protein
MREAQKCVDAFMWKIKTDLIYIASAFYKFGERLILAWTNVSTSRLSNMHLNLCYSVICNAFFFSFSMNVASICAVEAVFL